MAQSRKPENEPPHHSESEEEEETEGSSEEDGSESESEEEEEPSKSLPAVAPVAKKPLVSKITPAVVGPNKSSSSDEADSESDSPPEISRKVDPSIKPLASKPMDEPTKATKKPRSKPSAPTSPTSTKSAKRPAESEAKDSRKLKKKVSNASIDEDVEKKANSDDPKKQLFQRMFSEEDEIAILKGIIDYTAKKGADPVADMNDFHDFIKKSLHVDVSKNQLQDKVRRLKKKYSNNAGKEKGGRERNLKLHEQQAYDLSKIIWGNEGFSSATDNHPNLNSSTRKSQSQRASKAPTSPLKMNEFSSPIKSVEANHMESIVAPVRPFPVIKGIGNSNREEDIIRNGLELISGPKKAELEEKWKQLHVEEVELFLKRAELIQEQTKLFLQALKSSMD